MARKVLYIDDISGQPIDDGLGGPVEFSFDGKHYVIDLGVQSKDDFRRVLQPYIDAAATVEEPRRQSTTKRRAASGSGRSKEELQAIRDWCGKQGIEVAPRGRIAADILAKFAAAHEA